MRIIIAGGDGFCGWPTALHLSASGHEVVLLDNGGRSDARAVGPARSGDARAPDRGGPATVPASGGVLGSTV